MSPTKIETQALFDVGELSFIAHPSPRRLPKAAETGSQYLLEQNPKEEREEQL